MEAHDALLSSAHEAVSTGGIRVRGKRGEGGEEEEEEEEEEDEEEEEEDGEEEEEDS